MSEVWAFDSEDSFNRMSASVRFTEDVRSRSSVGGISSGLDNPLLFVEILKDKNCHGLYRGKHVIPYRANPEACSDYYTYSNYYYSNTTYQNRIKWRNGVECWVSEVSDRKLIVGERYGGVVSAVFAATSVVSVDAGGGGVAKGAVCHAMILGGGEPSDDAPGGAFSEEYAPPRFQPHVYSIMPCYLNYKTGTIDPHPDFPTGTGYRMPTSLFPPPRLRPGSSVTASLIPGETNKYTIIGSSLLQSEFVIPTSSVDVCVEQQGGNGGFVKKTVLFMRTLRASGDNFCLSQSNSAGA